MYVYIYIHTCIYACGYVYMYMDMYMYRIILKDELVRQVNYVKICSGI